MIISVFALVALAINFFFIRDRKSLYDHALQAATKGNYTDARGMIRSIIEDNPKNAKGQYVMARIYNLEENYDRELDHLQLVRASGTFPPDVSPAEIFNRIGYLLYQDEQYEASYEAYLETLTRSARNEEAMTMLAFMAIGQGEFETAIRYFTPLVAAIPDSGEYHLARGVALSMLKNKDALQELEKGLLIDDSNVTARILTALQAIKQNKYDRAREILEECPDTSSEIYVDYIKNKMLTVIYYFVDDHPRALKFAELCHSTAATEGWSVELYEARMSVAVFLILNNKLEKANEVLLELELNNPRDDSVIKLSDFRMDIEEGIADIENITPRGFDFKQYMREWFQAQFPNDTIYTISGLMMEDRFEIPSGVKETGKQESDTDKNINPDEWIAKFNGLGDQQFIEACDRIVQSQGYKIEKNLPNRERDGADIIGREMSGDKKNRALFRFRKWSNQPISDIFLREMQNSMNEMKVTQGYVVAGARLTAGAEAALANLKKIQVINEHDLGVLLQQVL